MRKLFLTLVATTALTVQAEAPAQTNKADELVQLTEVSLMMDVINKHLNKSMQDLAGKLKIQGSEEQLVIDEYLAKMESALRTELRHTKINGPVTAIYKERFSDGELQDIANFFRTEAGQKVLKSMPDIVAASLTASQNAVTEYSPTMQKVAEQLVVDIQDRREAKKAGL